MEKIGEIRQVQLETHVTGCFIECFLKKKLIIVYESNARKKIKFKVGQNF